MGVVIQAIRDSARGERCTLGTSNCNFDAATTVFCHAPSPFMARGSKADDWWGVYGCSACHETLDQHATADAGVERFYWLRGIATTQRRLYEKGIMCFPEKAQTPRVVNKVVPHSGRMRR